MDFIVDRKGISVGFIIISAHNKVMLLRRMTEHVKSQNWFAVGLDFFIVVFGVLLGLQAQQWLEGRNIQKDYEAAMGRLVVEIQSNLDEIDRVKQELGFRLDEVTEAFDLLQSCSADPEDKATVDAALNRLVGTMGMRFHMTAIEELTTDSRLLTRQSPEKRRALTDLHRLMSVMQREVDFTETLPLQERFENNPVIRVGDQESLTRQYQGKEWTSRRRLLSLKVPLNEACENDALVKSFYYWEKWQGEMMAVTDILSADLEPMLEKFK